MNSFSLAYLHIFYYSFHLLSVFCIGSFFKASCFPGNKKDLPTRIFLRISLVISNKTRSSKTMNVDSVTPSAPTTPLFPAAYAFLTCLSSYSILLAKARILLFFYISVQIFTSVFLQSGIRRHTGNTDRNENFPVRRAAFHLHPDPSRI